MHSQGIIIQAGRKAYSFLVPGQRGQVLAALSKAVYLLTEQGELFWLAGEDTPMHDRCAVVSTPISLLPDGVSFSVQEARLIFDDAFAFEIDHFKIWSPPQAMCILELAGLRTHLEDFALQLNYSQARGFGQFMPVIQAFWQDMALPDLHFTDPILQFAQPKVLNMARACLEGNSSQISEQAEMLVGLGRGLTPSGDDFLGGILFAIKTLQTHYPKTINMTLRFPIGNYGLRTHPISFALLKDLADGSAVEPLHQIINGLLAENSIRSLKSHLRQLTDIGHSTGWDLLTGLLTGLLVIHRNCYFNSPLQMEQSTNA